MERELPVIPESADPKTSAFIEIGKVAEEMADRLSLQIISNPQSREIHMLKGRIAICRGILCGNIPSDVKPYSKHDSVRNQIFEFGEAQAAIKQEYREMLINGVSHPDIPLSLRMQRHFGRKTLRHLHKIRNKEMWNTHLETIISP